jgi:antitoxin VapB
MLQPTKAISLNIKDPEAHQLASAISKLTGETLTRVVTEALRERYKSLRHNQGKATVEELLAIGKRASVHGKQPYIDHAAYLYDEDGLPK